VIEAGWGRCRCSSFPKATCCASYVRSPTPPCTYVHTRVHIEWSLVQMVNTVACNRCCPPCTTTILLNLNRQNPENTPNIHHLQVCRVEEVTIISFSPVGTILTVCAHTARLSFFLFPPLDIFRRRKRMWALILRAFVIARSSPFPTRPMHHHRVRDV
jgi:hypothetical protein